jgi:deoxyribonuclease-4
MFKIGCHVSIAEGVWNAPDNAGHLGCETFQIFTRSPQGGPAPEITPEAVEKFKAAMARNHITEFVVHCPYYVNFGSIEPRIYHSSISVARQELERASLLGAKYMMIHLGSFRDQDEKQGFIQVKEGLIKVLEGYKGQTQFLLEIAAGSGAVIGATFEELKKIMRPLVKFKTFGGVCFDTQHAFASGYDLRNAAAVKQTLERFEKVIGLKYLKMSHINDSKMEFNSHKDRHEHIGDGLISQEGFLAFFQYLHKKKLDIPLILETQHDKVEADIKLLKTLRDKIVK